MNHESDGLLRRFGAGEVEMETSGQDAFTADVARLAHGAPFGILVLSTSLEILYANAALAEMVGRDPGNGSSSLGELVAQRDLACIVSCRDASLAGEVAPGRFSVDLVRADGSTVAVTVLAGLTRWRGERALRLGVMEASGGSGSLAQARDRADRLQRQQEALLALAGHRPDDASLSDLLDLATETASRTLACSRVGVWLFDGERNAIHCTSLFDSTQGRHTRGHVVARATCPTYFDALDTELTIDANDAARDPRTRELAQTYLEPLGISSMLDTPIRAGGVSLGVVCHEHVGSPRSWRHDEITFAGSVASWVALAMQLAERRRSEEELRRSEAHYRELFDAAPVSLWEEDWSAVRAMVERWRSAGAANLSAYLARRPEAVIEAASSIRIVDANQASVDVYREEDKRSLIEHARARLSGDVYPGFGERLAGIAAGERRVVTEVQEFRADGEPFDARITVAIPAGYAATWSRVFVSIEDITESQSLSRRLAYEAAHDPLTSLVNRRAFEQQLSEALGEPTEPGAEHVLCYLDLDQFKLVNDRSGHVAGDRLLCEIADLLRSRVSRRDTLARVGGDEFTLLMKYGGLSRATAVAESLREAIESYTFHWQGHSYNVGTSIGVVAITEPFADIHAVMIAADTACYAAKDLGRNKVHVYRRDDEEILRRHGEMEWATRIDRALREDRLCLYRQDITPLGVAAPMAMVGEHYEILVRLVAEDGTLISPGAFLPAAERFGLAERVDRWVVRTLLEWFDRHPEQLSALGMCAVNLSGQSVGRDGFLEWIMEMVAGHSVPAGKLCFEITETAAIASIGRAAKLMQRLGELGCSVSLDDFGSGVSSFAYLKSLPVDFLKIDGLFVRDIVEDPIDRAMVRSINDIGHVMGKRTIAEFVENDAILAILRELGVDYAQGYGVGRPVPLDSSSGRVAGTREA